MITKEINHFDLQQTADSGQCFRIKQLSADTWSAVSGPHYLEVTQNGHQFHFNCQKEEFPFWAHYFDLDTDYGFFLDSASKQDSYLQNAVKAGGGIRILNQDPWEMIITFIISQQRTIPKIREAVENLSRLYGEQKSVLLPSGEERSYCTFPNPAQLSCASLEDLQALKLGYRAGYINRICCDAAEGKLNLEFLSSLDYQSAMEYLTGFYGIGAKIANCVCLFGLHHIEAFPIDTWIHQILINHYYKEEYDRLPKSRLYETMVQEHFGRYKGYAGVMQQYIFYYERNIIKGK